MQTPNSSSAREARNYTVKIERIIGHAMPWERAYP
jgi:hypothetical protein